MIIGHLRMPGLRGWPVALLGTLLLVAAAACGGADTSAPPNSKAGFNAGTPDPAPAVAVEQNATPVPEPTTAAPGRTPEPPLVDKTIHSVPLSDILFDTFGGSPRFLPLDVATEADIRQLRDAIRPIIAPAYGPAGELAWLDDDDLVIGYRSANEEYAYPVNVLDFHEIVNDVIGGVALLVTYCPLCFSGVVFSREVEGR